MRHGPLHGLRVLELADEKGHYCGRLLADMGADVVKIEPPAGDLARHTGPFAGDVPHPDRSLFFWHYNANKRGITLSLEIREGRDLLRWLAASADVLLETFRPGYLSGLGLGYDHLSAINPHLLYASLTPFGQTGPYRDFLTSDLVSLAMGGPMASCGYDDIPDAPPIRAEYHQAYQIGSNYAFIGILVALFSRGLTGRGQYIDASIHEACSCTTEAAFPNWIYHQKIVIRQTGRHATMAPTLPWLFQCSDGRYVNLVGSIPRDSRSWRNLVAWMESKGMAEDLGDERYADIYLQRSLRAEDPRSVRVREVMGRFFAGMPAEEAYHGAQQRGMAMGLVRSPEENLFDPHFRDDRAFFVELSHEGLDAPAIYPGAPYRFEKTPWTLRRPAPNLGQHNHEIYCEELGFTPQRITEFKEAGIV